MKIKSQKAKIDHKTNTKMDITNQIKWEKSNKSVQKMNDKNDK